jgi:hypothetical protein
MPQQQNYNPIFFPSKILSSQNGFLSASLKAKSHNNKVSVELLVATRRTPTIREYHKFFNLRSPDTNKKFG